MTQADARASSLPGPLQHSARRPRILHFVLDRDTSGFFPQLGRFQDRGRYDLTFATLGTMAPGLRRSLDASGVRTVSFGADRRLFYPCGRSGRPTRACRATSWPRTPTSSRSVRAVRLDCFADARGARSVGLVKIDTESTEPDVLRRLGDVLERDRPAIICEVLADRGTGPELERLLEPLGYRYHVLTPDGPRRTDRIEPHPEWLNHLVTCGDVA